MKNLLIAATIFLYSFKSAAPSVKLEFRDLADMNIARGAITSASDGKYFYVSNGFTTTEKMSGTIEKYDVANNSWSVLTTMLSPKQFSSSVILGSDLYVFNGDLQDSTLNRKVEIVNTNTGAVSFGTDNPQPVHAGGAAVWNDLIYTFGGKTSNPAAPYSSRLYCYDPSEKRWIKLASMPEAKEAKGVFVEGKLYVIGGYSGKASKRIDMFDSETNTWTQLADLPVSISANSIAAYGNKIYTLFDFTNQSYIGCYDILSNTFTVVEQKNMKARRHAGAHVVGDKLYIMGGNTSDKMMSCLSSLQVTELK